MSMDLKNRNIRHEIAEKLDDGVLRGALGRFAEAYPLARAKAYENVADVDALREQVKNMKHETVLRIEEVANQFEASVVKRGGKVFRAKDGDDVKRYLIDAASLAYFDAFHTSRLPANLIQAQRDCFGNHGYRRVDQPGTFHSAWRNEEGGG